MRSALFTSAVLASLCLVQGAPIRSSVVVEDHLEFYPRAQIMIDVNQHAFVTTPKAAASADFPIVKPLSKITIPKRQCTAGTSPGAPPLLNFPNQPSQSPTNTPGTNNTTVTSPVVTSPTSQPPSTTPVTTSTTVTPPAVVTNPAGPPPLLNFPGVTIPSTPPTSDQPPVTPPTTNSTCPSTTQNPTPPARQGCFPALNFTMPSQVPNSLDGWWCNMEDEYAFLGFSYEISACQSSDQLNREFLDARKTFNSRYIRLYGACDEDGFYDRVIDAAWNSGLGVYSLIWFGFDGTDIWKTRKANLFKSLTTNPKAPFVTRALQFGSEPLFDWAIDPVELANQVKQAKVDLAKQRIPVTVSEMAWGFYSRMQDGSQQVIDAIDFVGLHMLPYFSQGASTGGQAWNDISYDMNQMLGFTNSQKKIIWTQNGWPSTHYCPGVCPNSAAAISSVKSEMAYYRLLNTNCAQLKAFPKGGVGWFAHLYSDNQEPGYGIYDVNMNKKFDFAPLTSC